MRQPRAWTAVLALVAPLLLVPACAGARSHTRRPASVVVLDGHRTQVRWIDGDTFQFEEGPHARTRARLEGYNTLESYGPVHRWGEWEPTELQALAREATAIAAARAWDCTTRGRQDRYRRVLVSCPGVAAELVRTGHAMVYAVERRADAALLALQHQAQQQRAGMWAKGVPRHLLSSVHSRAENRGASTYDRLVDTRTGAARPQPHARAYRTCEEICTGDGADRSCMLYVPFERRSRGRPRCLVASEAAGQGEPVRQGSD